MQNLYKAIKKEEIDWKKEIDEKTEQAFRSKKLYLYYLQKGRCMYTGESIRFEDLMNDNLYDIDHIYPRHFVKDDSLEQNLVLVKKEKNAHKSDVFPIEADIQKKMSSFWKELKERGFISEEKYMRLTRRYGFSEEEKQVLSIGNWWKQDREQRVLQRYWDKLFQMWISYFQKRRMCRSSDIFMDCIRFAV